MTISKTCKIAVFISIALFAIILYRGIAMTKVKVPDITDATITFVYSDKNIHEKLTREDTEILKSIVIGKKIIFGGGFSCGFSPDISFSLGDMIFSVARDTCAIIKIETKSENRKRKVTEIHLSVSEEEKQKIHDVFNKHGGCFPCV